MVLTLNLTTLDGCPISNRFVSPLVQALAPRTVRGQIASATLSKPLSRECLVNLFDKLLSKFPGSGLCVSREPHLPRNLLYEFNIRSN